MRKSLLISLLVLLAITNTLIAQHKTNGDDFVGTWKGTSLCQVKNSPCHDETVVYYISKTNKTDSFSIKANKIVNGVEEEMGVLPFVYNSSKNELNSSAYGTWNLKIENDKIKGTLMSKGQLFRVIQLTKQK